MRAYYSVVARTQLRWGSIRVSDPPTSLGSRIGMLLSLAAHVYWERWQFAVIIFNNARFVPIEHKMLI